MSGTINPNSPIDPFSRPTQEAKDLSTAESGAAARRPIHKSTSKSGKPADAPEISFEDRFEGEDLRPVSEESPYGQATDEYLVADQTYEELQAAAVGGGAAEAIDELRSKTPKKKDVLGRLEDAAGKTEPAAEKAGSTDASTKLREAEEKAHTFELAARDSASRYPDIYLGLVHQESIEKVFKIWGPNAMDALDSVTSMQGTRGMAVLLPSPKDSHPMQAKSEVTGKATSTYLDKNGKTVTSYYPVSVDSEAFLSMGA